MGCRVRRAKGERMTIDDLRGKLDRGEVSSRELCDDALARIEDASGEGSRAFTQVYRAQARAAAGAADLQRTAGFVASPLAGLPVSVKDLFDVAGQQTRAGSIVLDAAPPAVADATIVARLRRAGAVIVGKTNMDRVRVLRTRINPHYGTPRSPWDRATGRIPGGSSSGAAVSVSDGMAVVGIGTDTGGSVRIPSALCGLTGFKPTAARDSARRRLPAFVHARFHRAACSQRRGLRDGRCGAERQRTRRFTAAGGARSAHARAGQSRAQRTRRNGRGCVRPPRSERCGPPGAAIEERPLAAFERLPALQES